ncbi:hypothetical protein AB0H76_31935 [Nocardia sp. NPDC050712]|uniref:hypothetical protein n=1 Tax=Nocardia sp. NPDC050712 TaxID=3155518 RepID=UPI0033D443DD
MMPISRRGLLGHAGAAVGLGLLAGSGRAVAQQGPQAPRPGQTLALSVDGTGGTLVVNLPPPLPKLDFRGARMVTVLDGATDFVGLRTRMFTAVATHPTFGKITLGLPNTEAGSNGVLALAPSGRHLIETWHQNMYVTFERCGQCPGPFGFHTLEPAEWTAELPQFPPPPQQSTLKGAAAGGARYRMTRPIRLGATPESGGAGHASDACSCAFRFPLSGANSPLGAEFARIEGLTFEQALQAP